MQQTPDLAALMRLAQSPGAQQLFSALLASGGQELQQAMEKASAGDYGDAKKTLSSLLEDPKLRALVQQLGGKL